MTGTNSTTTVTAQEQEKDVVASARIRKLVYAAFDSASSQLHDEISETDSSIQLESDVVRQGRVDRPATATLVESNNGDDGKERVERKSTGRNNMEAPQAALSGSFIYVPGVGFMYQNDDCELGRQ